MKKNLTVIYLTFLPILFFISPVQARSINAKCLLQIDGVTYMDNRCYFKIDKNGTDFFDDLRLVISCPDGRSAEISSCSGAEQRVTRPGVFGFLFRRGEIASLCWNEGRRKKATPCFEGLTRKGACWVNSRAKHSDTPNVVSNVKFCAWSL